MLIFGRSLSLRSEPIVCQSFVRSKFKLLNALGRLKLKALHRFTSTATAVEDITALQKGKLGKGLKKFLTDEVVGNRKSNESLIVVDPHLGQSWAA